MSKCINRGLEGCTPNYSPLTGITPEEGMPCRQQLCCLNVYNYHLRDINILQSYFGKRSCFGRVFSPHFVKFKHIILKKHYTHFYIKFSFKHNVFNKHV